MENIFIEGTPVIYTPSNADEDGTFIIVIGGHALTAARSYAHKSDAHTRGMFPFPFEPSYKTCVSAQMLWRFIRSENGFYIKNVGVGAYLTASVVYENDAAYCSLELGNGSEFHFTCEGWLAHFHEHGEAYLSYSEGHHFHTTSEWTSTMVTMSDTELYSVAADDRHPCRIIIDSKYDFPITVRSDGSEIFSGGTVTSGTNICVNADVPPQRLYRGCEFNGYFVPAGSNFRIASDTVIAPVIAGSDGGRYLSFISDVHDLSGRLSDWALALPDDIYLHRMVFGGDITAGNVKSIAAQQAAHERVLSVIADNSQLPPVITIGNHEHEYDYRWGERRASEIFPDILSYGFIDGEGYFIYNFGADEFDHNDFQSHFPDDKIDALSGWLSHVPSGVPIFINAHYPLHAVPHRPHPDGAERMIDVLNSHPNVVYLWGHNHGQEEDDGYGRIVPCGGSILYEYDKGLSKTISFTYCSHGAMYDAARTVAPYYGLIAYLPESGGYITLTYYDMSGRPVPYKGGDGNFSYRLELV